MNKTKPKLENTQLNQGQKVSAYMNINRKRRGKDSCISVKARTGEHAGRVIGYSQNIMLKNVEFVVQKRGWERVVESGTKNVHAYVRGKIAPPETTPETDPVKISYYPQEQGAFVTKDNNYWVKSASYTEVTTDGVIGYEVTTEEPRKTRISTKKIRIKNSLTDST